MTPANDPRSSPGSVPALRGPAEAVDWRTLYVIAGAAALLTVVIIPLQLVVFVLWPPPLGGSAAAWFALFERSRLLGLLSLDLLLLVDQALLLPIFVALYVALRPASPSLMILATTLALVGTAVYFASGAAFEMLTLSRHYAAATTEAQRAAALAAGETMLAIYQGTAFDVSYLLQTVAGLVLSAVMLRSRLFRRAVAILGLAGFLVGLGLFIPGPAGIGLALLSVVFLWGWYLLLGLGFLGLGRGPDAPAAQGA
jgi:hypothetical protein